MIVRQIPRHEFAMLLSNEGLRVEVGPFNVRINSACQPFVDDLYSLYKDYKLAQTEIAEFHVGIVNTRLIRKPFSAHIHFILDGHSPFPAFPAQQALAALEWGINLAIAVRVNHLLLLHSAVVERNGHAILFPAWPGSGKTTLCAYLVHRGYRLFSDEFGVMDPQQGVFLPMPRLMPLKNESIGVIRNYLPEAKLGHEIPNTQKGTVVHVRPPKDSILRSKETVRANRIIFPKWVANAPLKMELLADAEAFLLLASNAFNYEVLGETSFQAVTYLIKTCDCYQLVYSNFEEVIRVIDDLTN